MFNAASKLSFTAAAIAFVAGFATVFTTSDRVAFTSLVFASAIAAGIGVAVFYFAPRDPVVPASAEVEAATVRSVDVSDLPAVSPWPLVGALAVTLLGVGAALGKGLIVIGLIVAVAVAFAWLAQVWREHPSWTPAMTERINNRFVVPIGLPGTAILFAGLGAVSLSRIFLAVSADAAPYIGAAIAFVILGSFYLLSKTEEVGRNLLRGLIAVSTALIISAGVAGAVAGEREFHEAGAEHGGETVAVEASDLAFDIDELLLPAAQTVVIEFANEDDVEHNLSIYEEEGGERLFEGERVPAGEHVEFEVESPEAGEYYFQCDIHPTTMNGDVLVTEEASEPAEH